MIRRSSARGDDTTGRYWCLRPCSAERCCECDILECRLCVWGFFFFQAEDGIRDVAVTGVQTCALPISISRRERELPGARRGRRSGQPAREPGPIYGEARTSASAAPRGRRQRNARRAVREDHRAFGDRHHVWAGNERLVGTPQVFGIPRGELDAREERGQRHADTALDAAAARDRKST